MKEEPISLSKIERLMLINQFQILKKLNDDTTDYDNHIKALEDGYVSHYSWMTEFISNEVPEQVTTFVLDVLELHDKLHISFEKLTDKAGLKGSDVAFDGFDGNNEVAYMGYCHYFCKQLGRYTNMFGPNHDFNSHFRTIEKYKRMLEQAAKFKDSDSFSVRRFSADEIKAIIGKQ